jgi:MFS family permease
VQVNPSGSARPERSRIADAATVASLVITTALFGFSNSMVAPLLPKMQRAFHAGVGFGGLIFSISLAAAGAGTLLVALAADRFGNRRTLLAVLATYIAASLAVGLSRSVPVVLAARAFQGLSGALVPVSYSVVRSLWSGRHATRVMALVSGALGFAGGIGLFAVGVLELSYQSFALYAWAGTGLLGFVLVLAFVPERAPVAPAGSGRVGEVVTFSVGILLAVLPFLYIRWWMDNLVIGLAGLVVGVALVGISPRLAPDRRSSLFPGRDVVVANITNICSIAGFFGPFILLPSFLVERYPNGWQGRHLLPAAVVLLFPSVGALAGSRLTGRVLARRIEWRDAIVTGGGLAASAGLALAALRPTDMLALMVALTVVGVATGGAFAGLAESLARSGSVASRTGTLVAGRYVGGALGGALVAVILDHRTSGASLLGSVRLCLVVLTVVQLAGAALWSVRASLTAEVVPAGVDA